MQQSLPNDMNINSLNIDVGPLNSALSEITKSIRHHASVLSKVKGLEIDHRQIKKDLHLIRLDLAAKDSFQIVSNKAPTSMEAQNQGSHSINTMMDISDEDNIIGPDCLDGGQPKEGRKCLSSPSERQFAKGVVENLGSAVKESKRSYLRKDMIWLKAMARQLQEGLNNEIAQNTDMESRLESHSKTLAYLESEHGVGGSVYSALQDQREFVIKNLDGLRQTIKKIESSIKSEVDSKQNQKLQEMKKWFNDLDTMVRNRQSNFNSKIAACAKSSEVFSLQEMYDNELRDHFHRMNLIEKTVISNKDTMLHFHQQSSMRCFRRIHRLWKVRAMKMTWSKWQNCNNNIVHDNEIIAQRKKTIRKVLVMTWFANKALAWKKWHSFIERQQRVEAKQLLAIKLFSDKVELAVIEPTRISFNSWRRTTVALKIQDANMHSASAYNHTATSTPRGEISRPFICTDRQSNQYNLSLLLASFNDDKDGAIQTLAQEIDNIRKFDIKLVYKDMDSHIEQVKVKIKETSSLEMSRLESEIKEIESTSNKEFHEISIQLPEIQSDIAEMRNSLHGAINRVKVIEHTHRDRIEMLSEGREAMEEEISTLQSKLHKSHKIVQSLQYDSTHCQNVINTLLQKMNNVESSLISHRESTDTEINSMRDQLEKVNEELRSKNAQSSKLNDSLTETRNEVIQAKVASSLGLKEIRDILDSHGIHQPQWRIIIEYGGLYESDAKEKNYVLPINVISDGEEDIDIPSTLASFAHDYATWTAFKADCDALKLVVIGTNPDTDNAVEVETEGRRRILVER